MNARFVVPQDHPALAGHFPGHPVVPGVVLLDLALDLACGRRRVARVERARFLRPVLPGESVEVGWRSGTQGALEVTCRANGADVLRCRAWLA